MTSRTNSLMFLSSVYPSYNLHDHEEKDPDEDPAKPKDKPAVLLCSYTVNEYSFLYHK